MAARSLGPGLESARGIAIPLAVAAWLLPWVSGPSAPALADEPIVRDHRDPDAWVQVVVKSVYVRDERELFGEGEMWLTVGLARDRCQYADAIGFPIDLDSERQYLVGLAAADLDFAAGRGTVTLDRLVPRAGDRMDGASASEETGVALRAREHYVFCARMQEEDSTSGDDYMGTIALPVDEASGWGIGTHTTRSSKTARSEDGDYDLTFEIRRAPLPDLRPTAIRVVDNPPDVCLVAQNAGPTASGPFRMSLHVDGVPASGGNVGPITLATGETNGVCKNIPLPTSGRHQLALLVDEERAVPELDEGNNRLEQVLDRTPLGTTRPPLDPGVATQDPDPTPPSGPGGPILVTVPESGRTPPPPDTRQIEQAAGANLEVTAIRVKGQEPRGNNDCDPGKNDVTVVVKNEGTGAAGPFALRLLVDDEDDEATEKPVASLDAGMSLDVLFDDVRLKKGEHKLTATADAKKTISESKEDNNERAVTVRCQDEDD